GRGGRGEEVGGDLLVVGQQGFDLGAQRGVAGTPLVEGARALPLRQVAEVLHQALETLEAFGGHGPHLCSSRCSQLRANSQSRLTVATEIPTSWATAASVSPPKKRSSTTRLERGSSSA